MSYCTYCLKQETHELHKNYHDNHYGFPIEDDNELFGRLILEINQAGLSWETILKKEAGFRDAYHQFEIEKIASYDQKDRERLLSNPEIIRNKLKVNAAIYNANAILEIRKKSGTFKSWLDTHAGLDKDEWVKIFRKKFKFVGGEIVNEFLMSTGYLKGAHDADCPVYNKVIIKRPNWLSYERD